MIPHDSHENQPQSPNLSAAAPGATTYTCPMHPEVRQSSPGACPKCGMTLVPTTGAAITMASVARHRIVVGVLVAGAGFYLWTEHRAHLLGALPYLILGSCLLMHFFMHHDHGGQDGHMDHSGHRTP